MRYLIFITFLFICGMRPTANAQKNKQDNHTELSKNEESLVILADSMLRSPIPDDRTNFGFEFAKLLKTTLEMEGSSSYPFSNLGEKIHILKPEDQSFRLFNWLIAPSETLRRYYGIIQMKDGTLYPLFNFAEQSEKNLLTATLDAKHWMGSEYYRIKEVSSGKQKYYTLFGLNKDGTYSNKKILDVLYFGEKGPLFGAPIFRVPNENETRLQTQNRVIWEYAKKAQFSVNYDDSRKMIMVDRLRSEINNPLRKDTYIPTGQTDGFRWEKDQWIFIKEAIPILQLNEGGAPVDGVLPGRR